MLLEKNAVIHAPRGSAGGAAGQGAVAPPYRGAEAGEAGEYELQRDIASKLPEEMTVFFYRSRDEEWVPFARLVLCAEELPRATFREFDGRGHQSDDELYEVAHDIQRM